MKRNRERFLPFWQVSEEGMLGNIKENRGFWIGNVKRFLLFTGRGDCCVTRPPGRLTL